MIRIMLVFCLSLLLGGCMIAADDRAAVFGATRVEADRHTGWINAYGPPVTRFGGRSSDAIWQTWLIRTRLNAEAMERGKPFQLYVRAMFPKRVFLEQAYAQGAPLDTTVLDRERTRAGTLETVGINLTQAEAEIYAGAGLSLRVVVRRASLTVDVPAAYVAAVLDCHRAAAGGRDYADRTSALGCQAGRYPARRTSMTVAGVSSAMGDLSREASATGGA